jgi:hypothetical protein
MVQITGTPTQAGTYTFTLQATDGAAHVATVVLTIVVTAEDLPTGGGPAPPKRWLFTLNAPQPDGSQLAAIGQSGPRQLIVRQAPGEHHEASFDIQGTDVASLATTGKELAADVQVWLEGKILFCGRLGLERDANDGTGPRFNPTAYDYREVLRRRNFAAITPPSYSGSDRGFIAWNMISLTQGLTGGNLGIARGLNPTVGLVSTAAYTKDSFVGVEIDNLAQMDAAGFDWDVVPHGPADLRLDLWPGGRGTDKGVILEWGGPLLASYTRVTDPSEYGNTLLLSTTGGASPINPVYLQAADLATRPEGRWDLAVGTQLTTSDALATAGPWYLGQSQVVNPTYTLVMRAGAWQGPDHVWIGDLVHVRIKDGRLAVDDLLPVSELQFDIDAQNIEVVTVTAGRSAFKYRHPIARILRRLAALETI